MPKQKRAQIPVWFVAVQGSIAAACGLAAAIVILFPGGLTDPGAFAFPSPAGWMLASAPLLALALGIVIAVRGGRSPRLAAGLAAFDRAQSARWVVWAAVAIGAFALLMPVHRFGEWSGYFVRLRPLLIWIGSLGAQTVSVMWYPRRQALRQATWAWLASLRPLAAPSAWILLALVALGAVMLAAVRGVQTYEDYRYEAGVPILTLQVVAAGLAAAAYQRLIARRPIAGTRRFEMLAFAAIWIVSAVYWASLPAPASYMNPSPMPPNNEMYPFSDAAQYDLQAQSALLGLGLDGGAALGNPAYPALLALIHMLSGQDFHANMRLQAAVLAVLPALAYLLGSRLHSRALGVGLATMLALRGANTISAAAVINTASPKQMLTDFPAAIGIALVVITAVDLARARARVPEAAIWHGAGVAFTFLVRPTAMVLVGIAPMVALLRGGSIKRWLGTSLVAALAVLVFVLPWAARNGIRDGRPFAKYFEKVSLVTETRFEDVKGSAPRVNAPPDAGVTPASTGESENLSSPKIAATDEGEERTQSEDSNRTVAAAPDANLASVLGFHFSNNVLGSVLILPTSPLFEDLERTLRAPGTIWRPRWNGSLSVGESMGLLLSASVLALGGAALWRQTGIAAAVPLLVFVLYQLANSAGRTSGGRYLVPVDWIILIYYAAGLLTLVAPTATAARPMERAQSRAHEGWRGMLATLALVTLLGAAPIVIDVAGPERFAPAAISAAQDDAVARGLLLEAGFNARDVDRFLRSDATVRQYGRAFHPRWFSFHALQRGAEGGLPKVNAPGLQFTLIGPSGEAQPVFLYASRPVQLANASHALVIGCMGEDGHYLEAVAILQTGAEATTSFREGLRKLSCPLRTPVCDNNGNCE